MIIFWEKKKKPEVRAEDKNNWKEEWPQDAFDLKFLILFIVHWW